MLLSIRDVSRNLVQIRFRYGERAVTSAPGEFSSHNVIGINPVGRASFQKLDQFLYGESSRKIDKRVDMLGVYIIDFHVNTFVFGVLVKVAGHTRGSCFV